MIHLRKRNAIGILVTWLGAVLASYAEAKSPDPLSTAAQVDASLQREILSKVDPTLIAPKCDDVTFLRRIHLDLIGTLPAPEEIVRFALDPDQDKRLKLTERLLADERFGLNWSRYWRDVILYRRTEERALIAARPMQEYLANSFNENVSWDETVAEFITAEGDVQEVGSAGLILAQSGEPENTVAEISRIFMGIQIQCAQCHDHPTDRWKREQFHELAAFFPRVAVRPNMTDGKRSFLVSATDRFFFRRPNNNNRFRGTAEHKMPDLEDPSAPGETMTPVFFATGDELALGATDADRRGQLADWLTSRKNPWFAKAMVNRMWAELVGEGFYEPIDDIGPDRTASAPQSLEVLANSFALSGYDVKWLFRTITNTKAYHRESRSRRTYEDSPFLANANQRLRSDQLFDSVLHVLNVKEPASRRGAGMYGVQATPRLAFSQAFGYDPSDSRSEISGSVQQTLAVMNSPLIQNAMNARNQNGLGGMLRRMSDDEDLVVELYLRILAREPSDSELSKCLSYAKEVGNRAEAFEDIQWSLVNSTEFLHRR